VTVQQQLWSFSNWLPLSAWRRHRQKYRCVSVGVKLSFVESGRRWAHSPSPSKAPGISYQGIMKTSVRMLKTSGGLYLLYGVSVCFCLVRFTWLWAPEVSHQVIVVFLCDCYPQYQHQSQCTIRHCGRLKLPVPRRPVGQHLLFLVSSGASVGHLRVSSFFEPWLVRLSAAKSWVLVEEFPQGTPLPNVPSFTPVHHQ